MWVFHAKHFIETNNSRGRDKLRGVIGKRENIRFQLQFKMKCSVDETENTAGRPFQHCILRKKPKIPLTARQMVCYPVNNSRGKRSSIPPHPGGSVVKNPPANSGSIPGLRRSPEKEMATHSSILAWRIPWTEEPGRLQSMGSRKSQT